MEQAAQEIYRSSNGDRWTLIRDISAGRVFVRHEPNSSSGGQVTDTDVDAFLERRRVRSGIRRAAPTAQQIVGPNNLTLVRALTTNLGRALPPVGATGSRA